MGMSCPRCRGPLTRPASSRVDNEAQVCEDCGTRESMLQALGLPLPPLDQPIHNEAAERVVWQAHELLEKMQNPRP